MSPQRLLSLVVAIVTVAISSKCYCTATEYYVSAADGPPCPNNTTFCHPLSYYLQHIGRYTGRNDIIYFLGGTYTLDQQLLIEGENVTLMGLGSMVQDSDGNMRHSTPVIKCGRNISVSTTDPGLLSMSEGSVTVSHITINSCSSYPIALNAYGMNSIILDHLSVQDSAGGVKISAVVVNISYSSFVQSNVSVALFGVSILPSFFLKNCNITSATLSISQFQLQDLDDMYISMGIIGITDTLFTSTQYGGAACNITTKHPYSITIGNSVFSNNKFGLALNLTDKNSVTIKNSIFRNNSEQSISILMNELDFTFSPNIDMVLDNVTVTTTGHLGSPFLTALFLQNCVSTFVLLNLTIINSTFSYNRNSGLYFGKCISVSFKGTTIFEGNTGYNGGAIVLDTDQRLIVDNTTQLIFTNNHAVNHGGAIYVLSNMNDLGFHNPSHHCFYNYSEGLDIHTIFYFNNNTAGNAGTAIYGSNVTYYCEQQLLFSNISNFTNQPGSSVISSDVSKVCFCDNHGKPLCLTRSRSITAIPGQDINFNVTVVGDGDGLADGFLRVIDGSSRPTAYQHASAKCISLNYTVYNNVTSVTISAMSNPGIYTSPVYINFKIGSCPSGFHLLTHVCQCDSTISSVAECHSNGTVTRQGNRWLAYSEHDNCAIVHRNCPFDYCITDSVTLPLSDPDIQCSLNRAGRLCGGCRHNYSLSLGSNKCQKCEASAPTYLLIIPLGVAGIALVALLIVLNLTVSVGTINGLIFFANIVKLYEPIFFPNGPIIFLSQFISWLNLDLGIETCFYPGMTSCHKMWLQFVFPFYVWILMITVIIACRYSIKVTHIVGNNAVPVLATLLLLSYTKLLRTIILIISLTEVSCNNVTTLYWLVDPNITYLSSCHLPLFIVAVSMLSMVVAPYTLFLLLFPLLTRYSHKWKDLQKCYNKLKPFIDAYGGPYREKFHYWTGVSVLLRVVLALVIALTDDPTIASNILLVIISAYLVVESIFKVYIKNAHYALNVTSNVSLIAMAFLARDITDDDTSDKLNTIGMVAVLGCSVAISVGIIIYHFYAYIFIARCKPRLTLLRHRRRRIETYQCEKDLDSDCEWREPLLEDNY